MARDEGFAVWLTGLPASGKSTIARALAHELETRSTDCAVLESDELRKVLTLRPTYSEEERESFYSQMVYIGTLLAPHGVHVIFDATANRRRYRDAARNHFAKYIEVYVDTPLDVCMARDPKGIYRRAASGGSVPGLQSEYEPPLNADVLVRGDTEDADAAARRIVAVLVEKGYL
ncbi:MAG: adenylyl-sulfate kinase [Bryobacterales bacterium]|nr:adenylyl-sulfate kinase [Bryobacterales bacterium]MBV9401808.1 adenylyl-sulfate kinase [Bryobacterales bacterium]